MSELATICQIPCQLQASTKYLPSSLMLWSNRSAAAAAVAVSVAVSVAVFVAVAVVAVAAVVDNDDDCMERYFSKTSTRATLTSLVMFFASLINNDK